MSNSSVSKKGRKKTPMTRFVTRATRFSAIVFIALFAMALLSTSLAATFYKNRSKQAVAASTSSPNTSDKTLRSERNSTRVLNQLAETNGAVAPSLLPALSPLPLPTDTETITLYKSDCTTPSTAFSLGDTVCAVVSGGPLLSLFGRRLSLSDPSPLLRDIVDENNEVLGIAVPLLTDPQTIKFKLPSDPTSTVDGVTVDNRGTWKLNSIHPYRYSVRSSTFFTVSDPNNTAFNLAIYKSNDTDGSTTAGSNLLYALWVTNYGPDAASNVTVTDVTPANTTFLSGDAGDFNCTFAEGGSTATASTCTLASLAPGASAKLTLVVNVNNGTSPGTVVSNTATISADSSDTKEIYAPDNTAVSETSIIAGASGATCTLQCRDNILAFANTTEGGQRGAHVKYDPPIATGNCGTVTTTPPSDSFFPVGENTVTATSEIGDGLCSFKITVVDNGTNPPTIDCPDNKVADADSSCQATIALGTPTVTGDNVTVSVSRSDGLPMYNCDANGENCTRKNPDLPFNSGVTNVTWTATSHDTPGPWADGEENHITGTASCTQKVTVNDVTPPTINVADQTASADANCLAPIPDYRTLATVSDNCACASSDASQICDGRQDIVLTQDPAPGTMVGLGPHTITLTANDGSSNNNGAGNTATKLTTFTVNDTTPPTFTSVPANVTAYTGPNATTCDAVVSDATLGTATATDNCSTPTITRTGVPAGNVFPKGTTTVTYKAKDAAGNESTATQTVTVIDNTPPVISCPTDITVYLPLHTTATSMVVNYQTPVGTDNCPDAITTQTAGLASGATFPVGTTTNTFKVTDAAGNTAECSFTVTVLYDFTGFFSPVINPPTLNVVNAGRAIPVKFSLSGNKGLNIFVANSPISGAIPCDATAPVTDLTDTLTAGSSSLSYDATSDQYIYVWATSSSWAGTCRQLQVKLNDGTTHTANFKFR